MTFNQYQNTFQEENNIFVSTAPQYTYILPTAAWTM
jgi:hypothetical protein